MAVSRWESRPAPRPAGDYKRHPARLLISPPASFSSSTCTASLNSCLSGNNPLQRGLSFSEWGYRFQNGGIVFRMGGFRTSSGLLLLAMGLLLLFMSCLLVQPARAFKGTSKGSGSEFKHDYYATTCPGAETIIRPAVAAGIAQNPGAAPGLIRTQFHDCVGNLKCDASVLLDPSSDNPDPEKNSIFNLSLRGVDVIDSAKAAVEAECEGVVSCADIIAFAARDAVVVTGGYWYPVFGGRKDGRVSQKSEADANLPAPSSNVDTLIQKFQKVGIGLADIVTLTGSHTVGIGHCPSFQERLWNTTTGVVQLDPTMDPKYAKQLLAQCPPNGPFFNGNIFVNEEPVTPNKFDTQYYSNLVRHKGLFTSDQQLFQDSRTRRQVLRYASDRAAFFRDYPAAVTRMGAIGVSTTGEVRLNCRSIN